MMDLETLYTLVSEAIRRAEVIEDLRGPGAASAHLDVSILEEQIAKLLPGSTDEGDIARRGAVRAAISAHDFGRARTLAEGFLRTAEPGSAIESDLHELTEEAERVEMATRRITVARFPGAAKKYGIDNVRQYARRFADQLAPFPIT